MAAALALPLLLGLGVVAFAGVAAAGAADKKKKRPPPAPPPAVPPKKAPPVAVKEVPPPIPKNPLPGSEAKVTAGMSPSGLASYLRVLSMETDPERLRAAAAVLKEQGHETAAAMLGAKAHRILAQRTEAARTASVPAVKPKTGDLPTGLHEMVARAVAEGSPAALSTAAYALRQAGFVEAGRVMTAQASAVSRATPPPEVKNQPHATMEPTMPEALSAQVARYLEQNGDPEMLEALARNLRGLGYTAAAEQLEAKALSIRASLEARAAIESIARLEPQPIVEPAPPAAMPRVYRVKDGDHAWRIAATLTGEGQRWRELVAANPRKRTVADGNFATLVTGELIHIPESWPRLPTVAPVPPTPTPQPPAPALNAEQQIAERVRAMLAGATKGREDRELVKAFQRRHGLGADGLAGAGTLSKLASLLPLGNLPTTVVYLSRAPNTERSRRQLIGALTAFAANAMRAGNMTAATNFTRAAAQVAKI